MIGDRREEFFLVFAVERRLQHHQCPQRRAQFQAVTSRPRGQTGWREVSVLFTWPRKMRYPMQNNISCIPLVSISWLYFIATFITKRSV